MRRSTKRSDPATGFDREAEHARGGPQIGIPFTAALGRYDRPAPALTSYDQLLAVGATTSLVEQTATITPIGDRP